jgi:hypothetical protein
MSPKLIAMFCMLTAALLVAAGLGLARIARWAASRDGNGPSPFLNNAAFDDPSTHAH